MRENQPWISGKTRDDATLTPPLEFAIPASLQVINVVALYTILVTRPWASTSFFMMFFMVYAKCPG